jgi:hypothetical protein
MKQETLEEASEKYLQEWRLVNNIHLSNSIHAERCKNDFKAGASWQAERMYSEEDMRKAILTSFLLGVDRGNYSKELEDKLIEQLKKKV